MSSIVIALPKIEDAKKIRAVLARHGFTVASVCTTASNALSSASELGSGVLICSHRLPDMNYLDLSILIQKKARANSGRISDGWLKGKNRADRSKEVFMFCRNICIQKILLFLRCLNDIWDRKPPV